ncbi:hypothetical protein TSAR_015551 [Trichomalopsis sarcophagae]|uniref:Uncharacterized protein n=1 Tax=Trichomalopsis sarcophagae TaxID=543379 RepID=A0A232FBT0_9HYME|nr:hypothetical protein TSAR_015551 [Trichomalopsis sarcophagae]
MLGTKTPSRLSLHVNIPHWNEDEPNREQRRRAKAESRRGRRNQERANANAGERPNAITHINEQA